MWECKYHVVFIPKYRKKALYGEIRRRMGDMFRTLAAQKESRVLEGHLMPDHVHMLISIPPKYSVAQVIGYIKGKSTIHVARTFFDRCPEARGARQRQYDSPLRPIRRGRQAEGRRDAPCVFRRIVITDSGGR